MLGWMQLNFVEGSMIPEIPIRKLLAVSPLIRVCPWETLHWLDLIASGAVLWPDVFSPVEMKASLTRELLERMLRFGLAVFDSLRTEIQAQPTPRAIRPRRLQCPKSCAISVQHTWRS